MSEDKKILSDLGVTIGVLVVIAIVISMVAINLVDDKPMSASEEKNILDRIKPLGELATTLEEAQKASPIVEEPVVVAAEPMTAEQANAPKLGDIAAWAPRIAQGVDTLFEHAVKGFKGMPPRGGSSQLSDEDVSAALDYMVERSQ